MSLTAARELAVLSVVIAHPVHGYDIASAFAKGPMQHLGLNRSAIYAILDRFVKRGWIEEREEPGTSYPDRKICYPLDAAQTATADLLRKAGGSPLLPIMALTMLHDSGQDVREAASRELALRHTQLRGLDADSAHGDTVSSRLARSVLKAEIEALDAILAR